MAPTSPLRPPRSPASRIPRTRGTHHTRQTLRRHRGGRALLAALLLLLGAAATAPAQETPPELAGLDTFVEEMLDTWHVPGVAVAVVKDGEVVLSRGYGLRDVERGLPMTERSLLAIGSTTKAFTTAMLARLVDDQEIAWEEPVREYLPDFELADPELARRMTVRDLVTHTSGLPRHDLVWYGSDLTRDQVYERLEHLDFTEDIRFRFQYNNLMYMTAGVLIDRKAGEPWEAAIGTMLLEPLGMDATVQTWDEATATGEAATGYAWDDDEEELRTLPYYTAMGAIGPAGSLISSADDMARWVRLHLGNGVLEGDTLISAAQMSALHQPYAVVGGGLGSGNPETSLTAYGLGWFVQPYQGRHRLQHGGNIDGFSAHVAFYPNDSLGVVVLANANGSPVPAFVEYRVADLIFGEEPVDWSGRAQERMAEAEAREEEGEDGEDGEDDGPPRVEGTSHHHALDDYAGRYEHPAYGEVETWVEDGALWARFHGIAMEGEHWHYDTFRMEVPEGSQRGTTFMMTFHTDPRGTLSHLTLPLQAGVDDIAFDRIEEVDPALLEAAVGSFGNESLTVHLELRDDTLHLRVPGQGQWALEPAGDARFDAVGLPGYGVELLTEEDGSVSALRLLQPNGTFRLERVGS